MCGVPASLLVLRRAAPGQLRQAQVTGQGLVYGLVREGDGRAGRQRVDDADRGGELLCGVVRPVLRGQRQACDHPPTLTRKDRGQGGLDDLAGHDLIVLIDEDDLGRLRRVERGGTGVLDLHSHGSLRPVVARRHSGRRRTSRRG